MEFESKSHNPISKKEIHDLIEQPYTRKKMFSEKNSVKTMQDKPSKGGKSVKSFSNSSNRQSKKSSKKQPEK